MKRVKKHLYKRQYQTATGERSTLYYAIFRDWKKVQRTFPLGSVNLEEARNRLRDLEARNWRHEDFDLTAKQAKAAEHEAMRQTMTFGKWAEICLAAADKKSIDRDRQHVAHLKPFFSDMALAEIGLTQIKAYKDLRLTQPIMRYKKPVEGTTVKISTINREIGCLRWMLHKATEGKPAERLLDYVPEIKLSSEAYLARARVLDDEEYAALLEAAPRWAQRVFICAYETALSRGDLLKLTWAAVNRKLGVIGVKGGRAKTGARQIVPLTAPMREVLEELDAEFKKLPNVENRVFTREGRPITVERLRKAFDAAKTQAKITDFTFHDFRHTAITRWSVAGVPLDVVLVASGHKVPGMHGRYTNVQEYQVAAVFSRAVLTPFKRESKAEEAASAKYVD